VHSATTPTLPDQNCTSFIAKDIPSCNTAWHSLKNIHTLVQPNQQHIHHMLQLNLQATRDNFVLSNQNLRIACLPRSGVALEMDADGLATDFCRLLTILCCSHQQHQPTYAQQQHVQTLLVCLKPPTANRHSKLSRLLADSAVPLGTVRQDVGIAKSQM
jgi:hypothetical protein